MLVPARSGSERVLDKNFLPINGRCLVARAVDLAMAASLDVAISTDAPQRVTSEMAGEAIVLERPIHLARPDTPMEPVIFHAVQQLGLGEDDAVLLMQPTSPLRSLDSLNSLVDSFSANRPSGGGAFSVTKDWSDYWAEVSGSGLRRVRSLLPTPFLSRRSQERQPLLRENGLYYLLSVWWLRETHRCVDESSLAVVTPEHEDLDINTWDDWNAAVKALSPTFIR